MCQRLEVSADRASRVMSEREDGLMLMRLKSGLGPHPGYLSHMRGDWARYVTSLSLTFFTYRQMAMKSTAQNLHVAKLGVSITSQQVRLAPLFRAHLEVHLQLCWAVPMHPECFPFQPLHLLSLPDSCLQHRGGFFSSCVGLPRF